MNPELAAEYVTPDKSRRRPPSVGVSTRARHMRVVGLQNQFNRHMQNAQGSSKSSDMFAGRRSSMNSTAFKKTLRGDASSVQIPDMQFQYNRLHALKQVENSLQECQFNEVATIEQQRHARLVIPEILAKKVPLHWQHFIDDANAELSKVTSKIYDGGVSKGLKNGVGQIILPSGDIYKGHWKNDVRHGTGICKFPNGAIYKGEWREGRPFGQGILFSMPNEIIEGRFEGWKVADGIVKIMFVNGEFYEGNI